MVLLWGLGILNVDSVMFCRLFYLYVSATDSLALVKMSSTDANGREWLIFYTQTAENVVGFRFKQSG